LLIKMRVSEFLAKTASKDPVPGGGSISALAAASAASLVEMVARLTIGKKGFEGVRTEMEAVSCKAAEYRERLSRCIDRDSEAYSKVMAAFNMPRESEAEKKARSQAIQEALKVAAEVPLVAAEDALALLPLAETVIRKGNPNALTDGLVALMMARTAVLGALYNVKINLASMKDEAYVSRVSSRVKEIEALAMEKEKAILDQTGS